MSSNGQHPDTDHYWTAYFAATIAGALVVESEVVMRALLQAALDEFVLSHACSDHLRADIGAIRKGERQ